jgi:hypothetical protein
MLRIDYVCCIRQFLVWESLFNSFIKHTTPFEHFVLQIIIFICQVWKYVVQFYTTHLNNTSTTFTKSRTHTSRAYANIMSAWITSNIVMIQVSPMTTWMSKKDSRFIFFVVTLFKSLFIFMSQNIVLCTRILQRGQHRDPSNLCIIKKFQTFGFKNLNKIAMFKVHFWWRWIISKCCLK